MGELILCKTSMAANSYYIEEASLNIYSLEELSYYIYNNSYMLGENFVDENLCVWIRDELGLDSLCSELLGFISNNASPNILIGHLLRYCGYLTKSEVKSCLDTIASFEGKSEAEIKKIRADHMVNNGKYLDAVFSYESLLDKKVPMDDILKGDVLHNLGCALSGLFFFERAAEHFEMAYRLNREQLSMEMMLYSCLFSKNEEMFGMYVDRYQILPEDCDRIKKDFEENISGAYSRNFEESLKTRIHAAKDDVEKEMIYKEIIDGFKDEYRSLRTV